MHKLLLDADILIDLLRGHEATANLFDDTKADHELTTSIIAAMELVNGCKNKKELADVEQLLESFDVLPISPSISSRAYQVLVQYRLSFGMQIADALIASTAIEENLVLWTRNRKHFSCVGELSLF